MLRCACVQALPGIDRRPGAFSPRVIARLPWRGRRFLPERIRANSGGDRHVVNKAARARIPVCSLKTCRTAFHAFATSVSRTALLLSHGDITVFVQRPISAAFVALCALLVLAQIFFGVRSALRKRRVANDLLAAEPPAIHTVPDVE